MPEPLSDLEVLALAAVLQLGDDAYGVSIREEIRARTGRSVSVGSLYLPPSDADLVLGDLEEEFRTRAAARGRARATAWFVWEAARTGVSRVAYPTGMWEGMMTGLDKDLRGAFRLFRRAPGFAAVVVLTLAIGVGGATAVYSVIRGVLLSPLDFSDSERVVML